jgi:uncharacterized membrane protein
MEEEAKHGEYLTHRTGSPVTRAAWMPVVHDWRKHPVHERRARLHNDRSFGDRAADVIAALIGSWHFIIWQNVIVLAWAAFNIIALFGLRWDPYPFILLNLVFSWQASNTGPILQKTGNRQAQKDRMRDDLEAHEVDFLVKSQEKMEKINDEELEILREQKVMKQDLAEMKALLQQLSVLKGKGK